MAISKKEPDNGVVEFQFYQPENRTKWEAFRKAIYDKSTNQFLGRTPKSWGQLLIFYSIFYIVLAALFAVCMQGLFATLDDRQPRWKLGESLIGENPGLGFRPISDKTEEGSLIWYNITNGTTIDKWVDLVNTFLQPYNANQSGENFVSCNFEKGPGEDEVCRTTSSTFGNCTLENNYGYNSFSPCMFLKLNRIIDWTPVYYTSTQPGMPKELSDHLDNLKAAGKSETDRMVWVTCNGIDDIDKENIKGFRYHPAGFASYYYPYKNIKNYLSPIVAVEILDLTPNIVVTIECRAWAANIQYRTGLNRAGSVRFEIQVDGEYKATTKPPTISSIQQNNSTVVSTTTTKIENSTAFTSSPTSVTAPS
ncbi:sodium/potassium-transporting ATPase subunit beta-1-like [Diorhabda sublineata]|uniref:sodium/potassium-transporting ATPase subunit beta-1-like n=1 Tax=Diorhabda sublineata TaxID=1163346 RepID=UPI0024E0A14F|nr:sodium/potassium-transporting ATPase subunit beta-1-like [Diorhabda sublineata]